MRAADLLLALVRDPRSLVEAHDGADLAEQAPRLLALTAASAAALGFSVGQHHSLVQGLFGALKMPLVFLVPPLFGVPALAALCDALGAPTHPRRAALAGLVAVARVALFALAFSPVTWTFATAADSYAFTALSTAGTLALAGTVGLGSFQLVAPRMREAAWTTRFGVLLGAVAIWGSLTAQSGWMLRPFILKPELVPALFEPPRSDIFTELADRLHGRARVY
jgi:hypothetical protein